MSVWVHELYLWSVGPFIVWIHVVSSHRKCDGRPLLLSRRHGSVALAPQAHRTASQALLSAANIGKGEDELGASGEPLRRRYMRNPNGSQIHEERAASTVGD